MFSHTFLCLKPGNPCPFFKPWTQKSILLERNMFILSFTGNDILGDKSEDRKEPGQSALIYLFPAQIPETQKESSKELVHKASSCRCCDSKSRLEFHGRFLSSNKLKVSSSQAHAAYNEILGNHYTSHVIYCIVGSQE